MTTACQCFPIPSIVMVTSFCCGIRVLFIAHEARKSTDYPEERESPKTIWGQIRNTHETSQTNCGSICQLRPLSANTDDPSRMRNGGILRLLEALPGHHWKIESLFHQWFMASWVECHFTTNGISNYSGSGISF